MNTYFKVNLNNHFATETYWGKIYYKDKQRKKNPASLLYYKILSRIMGKK